MRVSRKRLALPLAALLPLTALPAASLDSAGIVPDPLDPVSTGGVGAVDRTFARLSGHRRLLVVGAHPDDEDNAILTWVSHGLGGESAYLSLSRGEGGQNLIGPELGTGLGLIRTGELLSARRIDGGRQLFARGFDFGYTRSLVETGRRWPLETMLEDAVRAVRRFKPQVVVAIFPPTASAGHGQHQMSAVVAEQVVEVAGEPDRFPELTRAGLGPWRPDALYRRAWSREPAELEFSLDRIDPVSGRSVAQIAAASRSQHRSQDMGREQRIGGGSGGLIWLAGGGAGRQRNGPFDGIDVRLEAIVGPLPATAGRRLAAERLRRVEERAGRARAELTPTALGGSVPHLREIVAELAAALELLTVEEPGGSAADLVAEKLAIAQTGLAAAAGLAFEAVADRETIVPGEELEVEATIWNGGGEKLTVDSVTVEGGPEWQVTRLSEGGNRLEPAALASWQTRAMLAATATPTVPYFLRRPRQGDLYDWSDAAPATRGEPYEPPPLVARFELRIGPTPLEIEREVVYRYGDQAIGEVRRPLRVVPAVELTVAPGLLLRRLGAREDSKLEITVRSHAAEAVAGRVEVAAGGGWSVAEEPSFALEGAGDAETIRLQLLPPDDPRPGSVAIEVAAVTEDGRRFVNAYSVVEYPHIRPLAMPVEARAELRLIDLELPRLSRVGYLRGASDRVPELLGAVGLPVEVLEAGELAAADLDVYDAIVVGSRAYETEPEVRRANRRLLAWVERGGLLLVQYQQYPFVSGAFPPYPLTIARPHGRVTDEDSPVETLDPGHPVLRVPNPITADDWRGWVQERGLYFADSWDPAYTPLLELHDPGEPPLRGGLLVARHGRGRYVYTGLSFFRQLPAGVPGAFRLFANLLALARDDSGVRAEEP